MKVYIASSFALIPRIIRVAKELEAAGHEVLVKWWDRAFDLPTEGPVHTTILKRRYESLSPEEFYSRPECKIAYETDFEGVLECDVLLFVADPEPRNYTGANVELGMALALDKECMVLGRLPNSAMYYPVRWFTTIEAVLGEFIRLEEVVTCPSCGVRSDQIVNDMFTGPEFIIRPHGPRELECKRCGKWFERTNP